MVGNPFSKILNVFKPIKGVRTIAEAIGGFTTGAATGLAKGIGGAAIDTVVGAGKLATAPFRGDSEKLVDQSKLKTEQEVQEKKEDAKQQRQIKKQDTKERKEKLDPKGKELKFKGTSLAPDRSKAKKEASLDPAVKILMRIARTIEVIENNVSTIIEGLKAGEKDDRKLKGKQKEKAIEDARLESQDKAESSSEPGLIKKGIGKLADKGVGGIFKMIIGGLVKFFAGKFIIETFFPQFKKPIFGFFSEIGDFFLNIRDALAMFQKGEYELAQKELGDAGGNLKTVFKTLAKFLSNVIDSILRFMGFEGLNLYEDAAKTYKEVIQPKIKDFKEKVVDYFNALVGPEGEGESFFKRLFIAFKNFIRVLGETIKSFFTYGNIVRIMTEASTAEGVREKLIKDIETERKLRMKVNAEKYAREILKTPEGQQILEDTGVSAESLVSAISPQQINNPNITGERFEGRERLKMLLEKRINEDLKIFTRRLVERNNMFFENIDSADRGFFDILSDNIFGLKEILTKEEAEELERRLKEKREKMEKEKKDDRHSSLQKKLEFDGSGLNAGSVIIAAFDKSSSSINVDNSKRDNYRQAFSSVSVHNGGDGIGRFRPSDPFSEIV